MKKLILALSLALAPSIIKAEHANNPDRFTSLGLIYTGEALTGDNRAPAGPFSQDVDITKGSLGLDLRVPTSDSWTLNFGLAAVGQTIDFKDSPTLFGNKIETTGASVTIGARYYFNK